MKVFSIKRLNIFEFIFSTSCNMWLNLYSKMVDGDTAQN